MVIKKRGNNFLGKRAEFPGRKTTPERHRSGVVHSTFRRRSNVVQVSVQVGVTGSPASQLIFTF